MKYALALCALLLASCDSFQTLAPAETSLAPEDTLSLNAHPQKRRGLVALWKMDDLRVVNAVTRRRAQAVSGVVPVPDRLGRRGKALAFTGSGEVVVGNILNDLYPPFTMAAWVRIDKDSTGAILNSDITPPNVSAYAGIGLQVTQGQLRVHLTDGMGYGPGHRVSKEASTPMQPGTWHHVAAVVAGNQSYTLYVDGRNVGGSYTGYGGPLAHNAWPFVIGRGLKGALDDVAIWNRALSTSEVQQLAK